MKYTSKFRGRRVRLMLSEQLLAQWRRLVAFMKAMDLLHQAMHGIVPAHRHGDWNGQQSGNILHHRFSLLSSWRPLGQYGVSSHPMAAFSGFYENPGPPSLGDVRGIAPSHRHGYQNGLQWRCFCSLSLPFLPGIIVATDHVMVHLN